MGSIIRLGEERRRGRKTRTDFFGAEKDFLK